MFTDDYTRYTETYTGTKKSDWFNCLKAFHSLAKTRTKQERPIEKLRSDYGAELQSQKVEQWLLQEGIVFEPSAPYSQEQNGVSERTDRTIMDMARATIIEGDLGDIFWPEVVLTMTYTKNVRPTTALEGGNPYEKQFNCPPDVSHLRILGSTVYVLIHEEERDLKSEKFTPRALKGKLVGYDGHTIYRVHIEEQQKVIRVKDLRVFEDTVAGDTNLPTFDGKPTFEGFLATDDDDDQSIRPSTSKEIAPPQTKEPTTSRSG